MLYTVLGGEEGKEQRSKIDKEQKNQLHNWTSFHNFHKLDCGKSWPFYILWRKKDFNSLHNKTFSSKMCKIKFDKKNCPFPHSL